MNGVLLIDKPSGPTSFDVVKAARRALNERKVGHAGTLDPLASGLLAVLAGQATRLTPFLMAGAKRYVARIALGEETDTFDALGEVTQKALVPAFTGEKLSGVLHAFVGSIEQVPPVYSALKQQGERLYRKARRGEAISVAPREVEIFGIDLVDFDETGMTLDVRCGPGTYIRSLARDAARSLGTVGHLAALRRIEASGFSVEEASSLSDLDEAAKKGRLSEVLIPMAEALRSMKKLTLRKESMDPIAKGRFIGCDDLPGSADLPLGSNVALLDGEQNLAAIGRIDKDVVQPIRVFI